MIILKKGEKELTQVTFEFSALTTYPQSKDKKEP